MRPRQCSIVFRVWHSSKKSLKHAFQCQNVKDLVFECVTPSDHCLAGPHVLSALPRTPWHSWERRRGAWWKQYHEHWLAKREYQRQTPDRGNVLEQWGIPRESWDLAVCRRGLSLKTANFLHLFNSAILLKSEKNAITLKLPFFILESHISVTWPVPCLSRQWRAKQCTQTARRTPAADSWQPKTIFESIFFSRVIHICGFITPSETQSISIVSLNIGLILIHFINAGACVCLNHFIQKVFNSNIIRVDYFVFANGQDTIMIYLNIV